MLGPGDNLGRLAKQHGVTVADIAKWNGVRDVRQLGVGVRLIVKKGKACPGGGEGGEEQRMPCSCRRLHGMGWLILKPPNAPQATMVTVRKHLP